VVANRIKVSKVVLDARLDEEHRGIPYNVGRRRIRKDKRTAKGRNYRRPPTKITRPDADTDEEDELAGDGEDDADNVDELAGNGEDDGEDFDDADNIGWRPDADIEEEDELAGDGEDESDEDSLGPSDNEGMSDADEDSDDSKMSVEV
jgi:hypothetical protein